MAGHAAEAPSSDRSALGAADRFVWRIEVFLAYVSAACIFVLMFIAVVQIVGRKLFNAPIFGYIDMVEIAMGTFAFLAISYCERLGGHVRMELLVGNLRGRLLWLFETTGVIVSLFIVGVLIYYGYEHAMRAFTAGDSTIDAEYPWWPSKLLVPLSFSVLWVRLLIMLWGYLRLLVDPGLKPVAVPLMASVEEEALREAGAVPGAEENGKA
ncbi:MAG: TRAP transporter small permease [Hyphomicrobiaceae bacterium]